MVETNLVIYALGTLVVLLTVILSTKVVKRRNNKPENIWEGYASSPVASRFAATSRPLVPPPPQMFNNR